MDVDQFLGESSEFESLGYLKLNVQERETPSVNRVVEVVLDTESGNKVFVQGSQESWVRGEADYLQSVLLPAEYKTLTTLKRHGLNANALLLLVGIAALPDLPFSKRLAFLAILVGLIGGIALLHKSFVNLTVIRINEQRPSILRKYSAEVASAVIAAVAAAAAGAAFGFLTGNIGKAFQPMADFFGP